jgi:hypothetical protein
MTVDDAIIIVAEHLDKFIATELQAFDATLRRDRAASRPPRR